MLEIELKMVRMFLIYTHNFEEDRGARIYLRQVLDAFLTAALLQCQILMTRKIEHDI